MRETSREVCDILITTNYLQYVHGIVVDLKVIANVDCGHRTIALIHSVLPK